MILTHVPDANDVEHATDNRRRFFVADRSTREAEHAARYRLHVAAIKLRTIRESEYKALELDRF